MRVTSVRPIVLGLSALLAVLPLGAVAAGESGPAVSVLADFGDGTYLWADVTLPGGNVTALKATELANAAWSLPPLEVSWFNASFCVRSPCALVSDIGGRDPTFPAYWHFYKWDEDDGRWASGLGASDTDLAEGDAIAWFLAVDDPLTFGTPFPAPTPRFRDVWSSFRGDLGHWGVARGTIPSRGVVLWERDVGTPEIAATPIVAYGRVFVATRGALIALDAETGEEVWRNPGVKDLLSTPALYDGHLVLGGVDGELHYVDAATGVETWNLTLESGTLSTGIASSPAVFEGRAYLGTFDEDGGPGRVVAVNLNNGTVAWMYATASVHMSQPAIADGRLYVGVMGTYDGGVGFAPPHGLLSLRLDGSLNWFRETPGPAASSPVVAGNRVYFTDRENDLYALGLDGSVVWEIPIGGSTSSPALHGGVLYVASAGGGGTLHAFDVSADVAEEIWSAPTGGVVQASLVTDGRLVCGATNIARGRHACFRADDGALAWSFTPEPEQYILGSPVVAGNTMYAVSDNGRVYAFRDAGAVPPNHAAVALAFVLVLLAVLVVATMIGLRRQRKGGGRAA